jgi:putative effector of murein hydrolase
MENPHQAAMSGLAMILAGMFTAGLAAPVFRLFHGM